MVLMRVMWPLAMCGLVACGGSDSLGPGASCGRTTGEQILQGAVTDVHDGDTLTVAGIHRVRLAGVDAPELSQNFGAQSRSALKTLALGQVVSVAYSDTDRYGRLLGRVFAPGCVDVNWRLVQTGAAWFYRAYQCDLQPAQRLSLDAAERFARAAREGLWAEPSPVAPWYFRNGIESEVPVCPAS